MYVKLKHMKPQLISNVSIKVTPIFVTPIYNSMWKWCGNDIKTSRDSRRTLFSPEHTKSRYHFKAFTNWMRPSRKKHWRCTYRRKEAKTTCDQGENISALLTTSPVIMLTSEFAWLLWLYWVLLSMRGALGQELLIKPFVQKLTGLCRRNTGLNRKGNHLTPSTPVKWHIISNRSDSEVGGFCSSVWSWLAADDHLRRRLRNHSKHQLLNAMRRLF
jgi:hypothetical protein